VGLDETDPEHHEISWLAPIARALLNTRLGERAVFTTPRGPKEPEVVAIFYEA
jgi:transcription elongation factor GreB